MYMKNCHSGARQASCLWTAVLSMLALIDREYVHNLSGTLPSLYTVDVHVDKTLGKSCVFPADES